MAEGDRSKMRVTKKHLEAKIDTINKMLFNDGATHVLRDGKFIPLLGRYILSSAYGGYSVESYANEAGGVNHACGLFGHIPAREVGIALDGFIDGLKTQKEKLSF